MEVSQKGLMQFVKFCAVGLSNTILSYVAYSLCIYVGMHYLLANLVGFIVGVSNAFYWSNKYVFKRGQDETRNPYITFVKTILSYASTGILLNSVLLWLLIDCLSVSAYIAPVLILLATVPTNYLLNKYWSFKTKKIYIIKND